MQKPVRGGRRQGTGEPMGKKSLLASTAAALSLESRNRQFPVLAQYSRVKAVLNSYVGWENIIKSHTELGTTLLGGLRKRNGFKMRNLLGI